MRSQAEKLHRNTTGERLFLPNREIVRRRFKEKHRDGKIAFAGGFSLLAPYPTTVFLIAPPRPIYDPFDLDVYMIDATFDMNPKYVVHYKGDEHVRFGRLQFGNDTVGRLGGVHYPQITEYFPGALQSLGFVTDSVAHSYGSFIEHQTWASVFPSAEMARVLSVYMQKRKEGEVRHDPRLNQWALFSLMSYADLEGLKANPRIFLESAFMPNIKGGSGEIIYFDPYIRHGSRRRSQSPWVCKKKNKYWVDKVLACVLVYILPLRMLQRNSQT